MLSNRNDTFSNNPVRVMVADDHKLFRSGLIALLQTQKNIFVVGEAENGEECEDDYFPLNPDILLIDVEMPARNGIETIRSIKETDKKLKAIILSQHDNEIMRARAYEAGARGYISKNIVLGELMYAINAVLSGDIYFGPDYTLKKLDTLARRLDEEEQMYDLKNYRLTKRETDIVMLLAEGFTSLEIADKLEISKRTVDTIRRNISEKCGFNGGQQLLKFAIWYKKNLDSNPQNPSL